MRRAIFRDGLEHFGIAYNILNVHVRITLIAFVIQIVLLVMQKRKEELSSVCERE